MTSIISSQFSNGSLWVILIGVLSLCLLIAGVVRLFVKRGAKALWIILLAPVLGLAVITVLGMLVGFFVGSMPSSRSYSATYSRTSGGASRSDTVKIVEHGGAPLPAGPVDSASAERLSEMFLADVYPSALQAAEALAAHVARSSYSAPDVRTRTTTRIPLPTESTQIEKAPAAEPPSPAEPADAAALPDVKVVGNADATILQAVADALRKGAMVRRVQIAPDGATIAPATRPAPSSKEIICAVRVDGDDSGTVQIVLESPDRQITRAARFVSKPWAANFAQYVAGAGRPVVRAESAAAASFEEAQVEAFDDAASKLAPYVNSAVNQMVAGPKVGVVDSQAVHEAILAELRKGKPVLDRFSQQFDRPYGKLWREQILVDASPNAIDPLAFEIASAATDAQLAARQTWWNMAASLGGMAVLIFAVYLVLNAATKGYYTWVLRLLAIGAIVAALALVA